MCIYLAGSALISFQLLFHRLNAGLSVLGESNGGNGIGYMIAVLTAEKLPGTHLHDALACKLTTK